MQEKHLLLLRILIRSTKPVPLKKLAAQMAVSTRSVINYVNAINADRGSPCVLSGPDGYWVDSQQAPQLMQMVEGIPENYRERSFYICKKLLLGPDTSMDLYDLSEELCISTSSLKNDLQKMNQSFAYLNVRFQIRNDAVVITGSERAKRKLMNHILIQSQEANLLDIGKLKSCFPPELVDEILEILEAVRRQENLYLNDFSKINIVLHLLTMVVRIQNGNTHTLPSGAEDLPELENDRDNAVADILCRNMESHFSIFIAPEDRLQMYLLVKSHLSVLDPGTEDKLAGYVGQELLSKLRRIVHNTEQCFCIRLYSEDFFARFSLHIHSLQTRITNQVEAVNPLKDSMRTSAPFLYDVAIYIVRQMRAEGLLEGRLTEDEISFIVLHIGAEIARQGASDDKISCALMIPEYLDIGDNFVQKIMTRFGDQLVLQQTLALRDDGKASRFDLVICVGDRILDSESQRVYVSPFLTVADMRRISDAIERAALKKSRDYLLKNFDYYFFEENFLVDTGRLLARDDVINRLCDRFIENEYVIEQYRENVFLRETAASTAFFDFAIPHSVCMEATVNTIGVMLAPNGIQWDDHVVYVVFLMAISPDSLTDFQMLYSTLAQLMTDTDVIQKLKNCESFDAFREELLSQNHYTL